MTTSHTDQRPPGPRLQLSQVAGRYLDGAWWPHSRDLAVELPELIEDFPAIRGRIDRVLFSRPDWDTQPRRVQVPHGWMKTGSFPSDDSHVVTLSLSTGERLILLVVPPTMDAVIAEELMAKAVSPTNAQTGLELFAAAEAALDGVDRPHDAFDDPDQGGEG